MPNNKRETCKKVLIIPTHVIMGNNEGTCTCYVKVLYYLQMLHCSSWCQQWRVVELHVLLEEYV